MDPISRLLQALTRAGLRLTPQRLAICRLIAESCEHPTAQDVHGILRRDYPMLSLATVYNTLKALVSLGAVNALGSAGDGKVHYDADTSPHINLACIPCHRVIDLPSQHVQALDHEVAIKSGYKVLGARVMYYGLCRR